MPVVQCVLAHQVTDIFERCRISALINADKARIPEGRPQHSGTQDQNQITPGLTDTALPSWRRGIGSQRLTLPALMHEVHTFSRFGVPPTIARRTVWMFGLKRRGVRRCENETFLPKPGPLPHMSQTEAMIRSIGRVERVGQRHAADENARRKVAACEAYRKPLPLRESPNRRIAQPQTIEPAGPVPECQRSLLCCGM